MSKPFHISKWISFDISTFEMVIEMASCRTMARSFHPFQLSLVLNVCMIINKLHSLQNVWSLLTIFFNFDLKYFWNWSFFHYEKIMRFKKGFSNLELEGQGRGIIMGVTRLLLQGLFYTIQTKRDQTFWWGVYDFLGVTIPNICVARTSASLTFWSNHPTLSYTPPYSFFAVFRFVVAFSFNWV